MGWWGLQSGRAQAEEEEEEEEGDWREGSQQLEELGAECAEGRGV